MKELTAKERLLEHCRKFDSYPRTPEEIYQDVLTKLDWNPDAEATGNFYPFYKEDVPRLVQALMGYKTDG